MRRMSSSRLWGLDRVSVSYRVDRCVVVVIQSAIITNHAAFGQYFLYRFSACLLYHLLSLRFLCIQAGD